MTRRIMVALLPCLVLSSLSIGAAYADEAAGFSVTKRARLASKDDESKSATWKVTETRETWAAKETAVIVCDMWNAHWCRGATERTGEVAPRINDIVRAARAKGATIVHAPSGCMNSYKDHPSRKRAQSTPRSKNLPKDIGKWCHVIPEEKRGVYPIDQADGGCDCTPKCPGGGPWRRQIDTIGIEDSPNDFISDNGEEIWSIFEARGVKNVFLCGVHTNMCVLGRPFGLRQLARNGKNVVLLRDLTDTMYNSRSWPFVSHFQGTDLIIEHIEKHVCPTVTSADVLGGKPFRFREDVRKRVTIVLAEKLYKTDTTLPIFTDGTLRALDGLDVDIVRAKSHSGEGRHVVTGLAKSLAKSDLLVLSMRRRALPEKDLAAIKKHLADGKPIVALRTSSHAFDTRGKHAKGHAEWKEFDAKVLGGNYTGHYKDGPVTAVSAAKGAEGHPIVRSLKLPFDGIGSLYKAAPLAKTATPLLYGTIPGGHDPEPVAWLHQYGKARVFYTSLGHAKDFENEQFVSLLRNGILWALGKPMPTKDRKPAPRSEDR